LINKKDNRTIFSTSDLVLKRKRGSDDQTISSIEQTLATTSVNSKKVNLVKEIDINLDSTKLPKKFYFDYKKNILKIPDKIRRSVGAALADFKMIKEGDKILVGISGGKDSLSLLHVLR